ncbi:MAG: DUF924 family protein [Henriciella sp.]
MTLLPTPDAVLDYWIGPAIDDSSVAGEKNKLWFEKSVQTDDHLRKCFLPVLEALTAGKLETWTSGPPRSRLAAIIVLDQFSRNIFRGQPRAFAQDEHALTLARDMVTTGVDKDLSEVERIFVYLPFEHSETLSDQEKSVALFKSLCEEARPSFRPLCEATLDYAHQHKDVIAEFGRFPHRNSILGRPNTAEEQTYLAKPGAGF